MAEHRLCTSEDRQLFRKTVRELRRKNRAISLEQATTIAYQVVCVEHQH